MKNTPDDEIAAALQGIRSRLDMLASINADNILIPGGSQERYHYIIEEAYIALGLIETQVDELRAELEYQHKRLDGLRDAALSEGLTPTVPHLEPPVQVVRLCHEHHLQDTDPYTPFQRSSDSTPVRRGVGRVSQRLVNSLAWIPQGCKTKREGKA